MRALIADDNREIRAALRLVLEELWSGTDQGGGKAQSSIDGLTGQGWEIVETKNGAETLRHVQDGEYDVVLLDWDLPGGGARRVLAEIRSRGLDSTVITISGRPEARAECLELGASHFVNISDAPGTLLELLRAIQPDSW